MPGAAEMVIFGGMDPITNDTFSFAPERSAWRELAPERQGAVPANRCHHTLSPVPDSDQALLFGGFSRGTRFNDTWRFDLESETWTQLAIDGTVPAKRCLHASVFIASRSELLMFGGIAGSGTQADDFFGDTHALDVATGSWARVEGDGPSPREGAVMVYSRDADAVFLWGGKSFDHYPTELWRFEVEARAWSQVGTSGEQPVGREDPISLWDSSRNRLTIFSGRNDNDPAVLFNDGYELDLVAGVWARVDAGTMPPPRWRASAAVDPADDRGYVFGGWRDFGGSDAFNDTWGYDLENRTWTQVLSDEMPLEY
jgi:N-acetylneuraminic acid mutarotase